MGEFGETLKRVRRVLGVTQTRLAEKSGLTQAMVALLEGGKTNGSLETAERLTRALIQEALPQGFRLEEVARGSEEPDGRYTYEVIVRKGSARYRLPIKGLEPLATKALWKGRAYELRVVGDLLGAATKALLEGEAGELLAQLALPVHVQIAKRIQRGLG